MNMSLPIKRLVSRLLIKRHSV